MKDTKFVCEICHKEFDTSFEGAEKNVCCECLPFLDNLEVVYDFSYSGVKELRNKAEIGTKFEREIASRKYTQQSSYRAILPPFSPRDKAKVLMSVFNGIKEPTKRQIATYVLFGRV